MEALFADGSEAENSGADDVDRRQSAYFDAVRRGETIGEPDADLWRVDWATGVDLDPRMVWHLRVGPVVATAWNVVDGRPVLATAVRIDEQPPADPKLQRHRLEVRDLLSGQVRTVECEVPVRVLAFAPDAAEPLLISGHEDDTVRTWALADLAHRQTLKIGETPSDLAVLGSGPDTHLLVSTGWGHLERWDVATGALLPLPPLPPVDTIGAGTLADGTVVLPVERDVLLWNPSDNRVRQLQVPAGMLPIKGATVWRSAGREVLTLLDVRNVVITIDLATGQHVRLTAHEDTSPGGLTVTRDGNPTVSGSALAIPVKWQVHLWDAHTMRPLGPPLTGPVAQASTDAVCWKGRDLLLTSSERDGVVALWDLTVPVEREPGHRQGLAAVTVTEPDGVVVSADEGGTLVARRAADGSLLVSPVATDIKMPKALAAWTDGDRPHAATGYGRLNEHEPLLYRWDLAAAGPSGAPVRTNSSFIQWIVHQRLRTGDALIAHGFQDIAILNPSDGSLLASVPHRVGQLTTGFAVGKVGGRATAALSSYAKPARLINLDNPSSRPKILRGTEGHHVLALLDGRLVTVRSELLTHHRATALRAWDHTGRPAGPEIDGPTPVTAVAGLTWPELYVARADSTLTLVDLSTGKPSTPPLLLPAPATCLAAIADEGVVVGFGHDVALVRPPDRKGC
ncbi:WD40 repeat domain-containing protein [Kitasatospora sp. NPDC059673]|uniref:WD40 repeat domain-containing protein n=1 Tax=Kitasatospora sp. NPDC059673 TaxID=3346901 RepID=UPI003698B935